MFFSSRRRHTRYWRDWSSDVCSSDLTARRFLQTVERFKERVGWHGHTAEGNPSGGNNYRGLYNISIKSIGAAAKRDPRSEEHTSELQSRQYLVCRLLLEKKNKIMTYPNNN